MERKWQLRYKELNYSRNSLATKVEKFIDKKETKVVTENFISKIPQVSSKSEKQISESTESNLPTAPLVSKEILQTVFADAWNALYQIDKEKTFVFEVTDTIAPGYSHRIKKPMWLNKMQQKIKSNSYSSLKEFDEDVKLIVRNCKLWNGPDSTYTMVFTFIITKYITYLYCILASFFV